MLLTPKQELIDLRHVLRLTQAQMAEAMEVPFRTYQALEGEQNPVKPMHLKAARYAAMEHARKMGDATLLPRDVREVAAGIALLEKEAEQAGRLP